MGLQRLCIVYLALVGCAASATAADTPGPPDSFLAEMRSLGIEPGNTGLLVTRLEGGEPLWSLNPQAPRNPASVMKLVTTFAALDVLGPGYRWPVEAWTVGARAADGKVGDLYIKGYGNPFWVEEQFARFVLELEHLGTRHIAGDIVLDASHYRIPQGDPEAFDGKGYRVYNVLPHPLTMNFNSVRFLLVPDPASGQLVVRTQPEFDNLVIDNDVVLERNACRSRNIDLDMRVQALLEGRTRVAFSGRFPARCQQFELTRAVMAPEEQLVGAFVSQWRARGGTVSGRWRHGTLPEEARLLHRQMSRPLGDLIRSANKFSNNVMMRQIYLTLGAESFGAPSDLDKSMDAVRRSLAGHGLQFPELRIENGAGLSRDALIAPASLMALLQAAWRHRFGSDFFGSLPVPGVDGTLESRFASGEFVGQAYVKTGTIDHVAAIAGLVQALDGERYLVVLLVNQENVHRGTGRALQRHLLRALVGQGG